MPCPKTGPFKVPVNKEADTRINFMSNGNFNVLVKRELVKYNIQKYRFGPDRNIQILQFNISICKSDSPEFDQTSFLVWILRFLLNGSIKSKMLIRKNFAC
jgi:hypothetical protein